MPSADARFVDIDCEPATCRSATAADRGSAGRVLSGHLSAPPLVLPGLDEVATPGRVQALGRFECEEIHAALAGALPADLGRSLRQGFEWYACRGAFFHNDAHYGEVLFGAWCVAGPAREIVLARLRLRLPAAPGDWVVFDPFEPHAVLDAGDGQYRRARYEGAPVSLFIGFELELDARVRQAFGVGAAPPGSTLLASSVAVHAETGEVG